MDAYPIVKTLHILSSVLIVGTGFGTAFYLFFTNRSNSLDAIAVVSRLVCRADWWFTTPAAIFQPLSGFWLAYAAGFDLRAPWLLISIGLYVFAGACWLPVLWLQHRMAHVAAATVAARKELPASYWADAHKWELLGYPAFIAMIAIYALMVTKPSFG